MSDGAPIAIDWFDEPVPRADDLDARPLLVCIGGLGGGHHEPYMKHTMTRARSLGY